MPRRQPPPRSPEYDVLVWAVIFTALAIALTLINTTRL